MPTDEAALASARQDKDYPQDNDYHRHLAAEIVAMLPEARDDALRVLRLAHAILRLTPEPPQASDPQPRDAA